MCESAAPLPDDLALCHEIIRQQAAGIGPAAERLRGVVDRAGPARASQEPDRPGDRHAQSNRAALCRYPEHGELSIDNNLAERMLRAQAIGRRNWTFLGSDRGGRTAAVLYSLTGTCGHHDVDPFAYREERRCLTGLPVGTLVDRAYEPQSQGTGASAS